MNPIPFLSSHIAGRGPEFRLAALGALVLGTAGPAQGQDTAPAVTVRLEIHNGPQDDRYEALSRDAWCGIEREGRDTLTTAFRPDFPSGVTRFALVVPNPHDATRGTSSFRFELEVVTLRLGKIRYTVEGREGRDPRGSGSVTLTLDTLATRARFGVRTEGGIDVSGSVVCRRGA